MRSGRNLLLLTTSYPRSGDGSEAAGSFVADFAVELARHVPVRVVAPGNSHEVEPSVDGAPRVYRFAAPTRPMSTLRPWHPLEALDILQVLDGGNKATRRAAADGETTHCLALWALPCGVWARSLWRATGTPYSVWALGSDVWGLGRIPLLRGLLGRVLRDATNRFADGVALARDAAAIGKCPVEFLPSTRRITSNRARPLRMSPPYRLLFLGRWHPNKGIDILLDALFALEDDDWRKIELVEVCGGGPLHRLVESKMAGLRSAGRPVELRGFLDKSEAEKTIANADFLLLPSRVESIPVVFSDAMKLGCPVISMPVGDLPQMIDSIPPAGILSEGVDAASFATAVRRALHVPPAEFSLGLLQRSRWFDLGEIAERLHRRTDGP
jgi:glycosyltransferase involved in cell wall biosynthesis